VLHDDVADAHLTDLLKRFLLGTFADREHGDHGGNAKDNAEHRQQCAQLVRSEADYAQGGSFAQIHFIAPSD
jgi:hypothetical protein